MDKWRRFTISQIPQAVYYLLPARPNYPAVGDLGRHRVGVKFQMEETIV